MRSKNIISELPEEQLDKLLAYTPDFSEKNLENIKQLSLEKLNIKENQIRGRKKTSMRKLAVIAAAAVLLLATSTAIFAATGGLEQFLSRFNPNFGEFAIAPLQPAFAESEGIRIEAIGAQQIDHVVLVYVAMTDLSEENRLSRHMSPDLEIHIDGEAINGPSSSRRLDFDASTNTAYFEMRIVGDAGMPKADTIELIANRVQDFEHSGQIRTAVEGDWRMIVNSSNLGIKPIVWSDIPAGNLHIEHMSLSPFGVQINGSHSYEVNLFPVFDVRIEFENRWLNTRLPGGGGGIGHNHFSHFQFSDTPIDLEAVTAIIINGERIIVP